MKALYDDYWLAAANQIACTADHRFLMSFDVDLDQVRWVRDIPLGVQRYAGDRDLAAAQAPLAF